MQAEMRNHVESERDEFDRIYRSHVGENANQVDILRRELGQAQATIKREESRLNSEISSMALSQSVHNESMSSKLEKVEAVADSEIRNERSTQGEMEQMILDSQSQMTKLYRENLESSEELRDYQLQAQQRLHRDSLSSMSTISEL